MANLPLLLFPTPENANRTKQSSGFTRIKYPTLNRQGERLIPKFRELQNSFTKDKVQLQQTPLGIEPEQVLVFETIGNIEDFSKAVKKIPGLEWMGEIEIEEILPDEDFYFDEKPEQKLKGRLYLVMTNQQALTQMLSLWTKYKDNPTLVDFRKGEYHGLAKFRDVFKCLKDIRRWSIEDRLAEKEVFDIWREDLNLKDTVRFEAELWYRRSEVKRKESEQIVSELIKTLGGNIKDQCVIESIAYHSILGEIPAATAQQIINHPDIDLLKCDNIMFIRPTGQMVTGRYPVDIDVSDHKTKEYDLPSGEPILAILDGMPLENHSLLSGRLVIDDPDDWASDYQAIDRQHGTAISSLIIYGDLNENEIPLNKPIYIRPIMKPITWASYSPRIEYVPDDVLFVDYIHRVVKRLFEGDDNNEPIAPSVKIINLSIGDQSRQFTQVISPLARLLDWLSTKYNILFIISSGNHSDSIQLDFTQNEFDKLQSEELERIVVKKIYEDARHRRILSPAESINGLTIGAYHYDNTNNAYIGHLIDVFNSNLPSPITSFGSGYRRSIKPDLIYNGGRVLYSQSINDNKIVLRISDRKVAPGIKVAAPSKQVGDLDKCQFCCGSSNASALISRSASLCYDYLREIFENQAPDANFDYYAIPIVKAMLIHGCSWNTIGEKLDSLLRTPENGRQLRRWISRLIGYGIPEIDKVFGCTEQRASLIGFGQLKDEEAHVFNLPLPPSLNAQRGMKKFTVTLSWLSPIVPTTQRYREAQLWFDFEEGTKSRESLNKILRVTGIDCDSDATRRGTVQHEIFIGDSAVTISEGDILRIKVNCRNDAGKISRAITYGLIVSLEVAEELDIPIYNEIRTRIAPTIEIRP